MIVGNSGPIYVIGEENPSPFNFNFRKVEIKWPHFTDYTTERSQYALFQYLQTFHEMRFPVFIRFAQQPTYIIYQSNKNYYKLMTNTEDSTF